MKIINAIVKLNLAMILFQKTK